MKKEILLSLIFVTGLFSAQYVGINTTTPQSTLDVTAKNSATATEMQIDGVLVPRVSKSRAEAMGKTVPNANLIFVNDITDPTTVDTTSLIAGVGFYYFDSAQTKWIPLNYSANDWHTTGNAGTSSSLNFLGTTDLQPLTFKINSVQGGFIGLESTAAAPNGNNTSLGYRALFNGTATAYSNTAIGTYAMENMGSVTTGTWLGENVAVGTGAMRNAVGGEWNTAVGANAMGQSIGDPADKSSLRNNVALGISALAGLTKGSFNIAIGPNAMSGAKPIAATDNVSTNIAFGLSTMNNLNNGIGNVAMQYQAANALLAGNDNVLMGRFAGNNMTSGSSNVMLGVRTGNSLTTGSNNIIIGSDAGAKITSGDYNISLGQETYFIKSTGSGQLNLGNVIWGTGMSNVVTASTGKKIGINTNAVEPNSTLQVGGSFAVAYDTPNSGTYTLTEANHTVRIYNGTSDVVLPNANTCKGRIYILIGSNGIATKNISFSGGGSIYDDVTNTTITSISSNQRIQIQSDGAGWIVIGR